MTSICYMVVATLPDGDTAAEYVAWLQEGHVDQVVMAGAQSGMIVRLESTAEGKPRVMTQYVFPSSHAFHEYVARHAPALRAEGLKKFGPERGVQMERMLGEIV